MEVPLVLQFLGLFSVPFRPLVWRPLLMPSYLGVLCRRRFRLNDGVVELQLFLNLFSKSTGVSAAGVRWATLFLMVLMVLKRPSHSFPKVVEVFGGHLDGGQARLVVAVMSVRIVEAVENPHELRFVEPNIGHVVG